MSIETNVAIIGLAVAVVGVAGSIIVGWLQRRADYPTLLMAAHLALVDRLQKEVEQVRETLQQEATARETCEDELTRERRHKEQALGELEEARATIEALRAALNGK